MSESNKRHSGHLCVGLLLPCEGREQEKTGGGGERRRGDPLLHQSQKRKARAGVKRSVLHDLEDVPESVGVRSEATSSDLFIRFD